MWKRIESITCRKSTLPLPIPPSGDIAGMEASALLLSAREAHSGARANSKPALGLARTPRRLPCLDEEFLKIAHHGRIALRQFRRDPVPQRQQILPGALRLLVSCIWFAISRARLKNRLLVSAARP
jgi:hypothetical protein